MDPQHAFAHLDPQNPNNWVPAGFRFTVEVRTPRTGEWFIGGAKVYRATRDNGMTQTVIVAVHSASEQAA